MKTKNISYFTLEGTYEQIGRQMALKTNKKPGLAAAPKNFVEEELDEALALYEEYCPGIVSELKGFAKACQVPMRDIAYTWMTYLIPRCSGLIVAGNMMEDGHTKLFRNYEFDLEHEDLMVLETRPEGKYAHIGGSVVLFGRSEGINECGLAVSMSSCGLPVSNMSGMRRPKIKGLQFWAVIRSVLENCKNVEEALALVQKMPIAYNINLYLADAHGQGCIFETMDGKTAYEKMDAKHSKQYLCGTNHIAIDSFKKYEPFAMKNSVVRLQAIESFMESQKSFREEEITTLFLDRYPKGLSSRFYDAFFGTIKTVVMDTTTCTYRIHWLVEEENGWETYQLTDDVGERISDHFLEKCYVQEQANPLFFDMVDL